MIVLDCEQGTRAWVEARLGVVTASEVGRIVTPTGKRASGEAVERYACELMAETFTGEPVVEFDNEWTERGRVLEPDARDEYVFATGNEYRHAGFVYRDESRTVGCSPDGLVGDDGGLEIKCPNPGLHLMHLAGGVVPKKHRPQVQGCIWVTGAAWWDFMSFHPDFPPLIVRAEPDPAYQAALSEIVPAFVEDLAERRAALEAMGLEAAA